MKKVLLLGSESESRQNLLIQAKIPFHVIGHIFDEAECDWSLPFEQLLKNIAQEKMAHVILPEGKDGDTCFVLTADTLGKDIDGIIHGKPISKADAIAKIRSLRRGGIVATAFCLEKKIFKNTIWQIDERVLEIVTTKYIFDMPDEWIEQYLDEVPHYQSISGAITIEGFGAQFLKSIDGSYTTIIGLPMFELREALERLGFY
jgi:nucleoside triphosphate pyrophosphatase